MSLPKAITAVVTSRGWDLGHEPWEIVELSTGHRLLFGHRVRPAGYCMLHLTSRCWQELSFLERVRVAAAQDEGED